MAEILVRYEDNNSPRYDGKIWREELKCVVEVNGQAVDIPQVTSDFEVKPGDHVVICRLGKGRKRGRRWKGVVMSQPDAVEEASPLPVSHTSLSRKRTTDTKGATGPPKKKTKAKSKGT